MLAWIVPSTVALIGFAWAVYERINPRVLCKVRYMISATHMNHQFANVTLADVGGLYDGSGTTEQKYVDLVGIVFELRSSGNHAASGILIHARLKHSIYRTIIQTDEEYGSPYGEEGEFNLRIPNLNPTDVIRVTLLCDKSSVMNGEDILVEHRVSLNQGKAELVNHW